MQEHNLNPAQFPVGDCYCKSCDAVRIQQQVERESKQVEGPVIFQTKIRPKVGK